MRFFHLPLGLFLYSYTLILEDWIMYEILLQWKLTLVAVNRPSYAVKVAYVRDVVEVMGRLMGYDKDFKRPDPYRNRKCTITAQMSLSQYIP